jgi:hypothetical protein
MTDSKNVNAVKAVTLITFVRASEWVSLLLSSWMSLDSNMSVMIMIPNSHRNSMLCMSTKALQMVGHVSDSGSKAVKMSLPASDDFLSSLLLLFFHIMIQVF